LKYITKLLHIPEKLILEEIQEKENSKLNLIDLFDIFLSDICSLKLNSRKPLLRKSLTESKVVNGE